VLCGEHPSSQQCEAGSPVHRAVDGLEPVDLATHLPVAPLEEDCREHCVAITPNTGRPLPDKKSDSVCFDSFSRAGEAQLRPKHVSSVVGEVRKVRRVHAAKVWRCRWKSEKRESVDDNKRTQHPVPFITEGQKSLIEKRIQMHR
jgi:hypothetical protein